MNRLFLLAVSLLVLGGCNATATAVKKPEPASIEVQEVGFTIIQEIRVAESVRADYEAAVAALRNGQTKRGIELLEAVTQEAPEAVAPHINLGVAYHRAGALEKAEEQLQEALRLNGNHPVALTELGIIHRKNGRFAEARKNYEAALLVYPGYHYARRNLGILCDLYLVDRSCAITQYEAYLQTVDEDTEVNMWLSDLRARAATE